MSAGNASVPLLVAEIVMSDSGSGPCTNNESLCESGVSDTEILHNGTEQDDWGLKPIDLAIVGIYLVCLLGLGIWFGYKRKGGTEEYFLAGRTSSWPLIGLSIFASNISSTTLVGLAGDAYAYGIAVYSYEWMAVVVLVIVAGALLPGLVKSRVFTIPELLHCMYNPVARYYFSALTVFLNVVVDTAGTLYAGALLLQALLPGWQLWHIMIVLAAIAGLYTVTGGLAAVMATDAIQAILLLAGSVMITVWAIRGAGGWRAMVDAQPPGYMSIIRPLDDPNVPWLGLIGIFILSFYFFATNQFMAQRLLSARSVRQGQWGALLAGALKLPVLFIMVIPGVAARVLYPDLVEPDKVYPTLMFDLLPPGVLGLVMAGFLAALMSQLDSTLNAVATLVTMDWVRQLWPDMSAGRLKLIGQGVTMVVMVLSVAWAPQIQYFPSLFQYLQQILSYTIPPVVAIYIMGFFWDGATPMAANVALLLGTLAGVALFLLNEIFKVSQFHFLYVPPILLSFSILVLLFVSLVSPRTVQEDRIVLWSVRDYMEETKVLKTRPLWQNYRIYSLILLAATATIVGVFW